MIAKSNLLIIQGGGPTPVFNASLASIVREGLLQPRIGHIFGCRFGMQGLAHGNMVQLDALTDSELTHLRNSPGAALGSSRFKPTEADLQQCVHHLRQHRIRNILFMGGNGTMRGADLFLQHCVSVGYDVQIVGVPKTIDNDIAATDHCPGFGSAGRYVAQSTLDLSADIRTLPQPVSIFETLGRDVGWLAACSTLGKRHADDAPHLVLIPEIPFHKDSFLSALDNIVRRIGWAVVVASEGTSYADGTPVFEQHITSRDGTKHRPLIGGVAQYLSGLVGEQLGLRCRSEKPGLIGRSCLAHVAVQDLRDAEEVGRQGVRALVSDQSGCMVALRPAGSAPATALVPLKDAGGPRRALPPEWISHDGLAVNNDFREYARPLVGELAFNRNLLGSENTPKS